MNKHKKNYTLRIVLLFVTALLLVGDAWVGKSCTSTKIPTQASTATPTSTIRPVPTVTPTMVPTTTPTIIPSVAVDPRGITFLKFEKPADSTLTDLGFMYQTLADIFGFELTTKVLLGDTTGLYSPIITYDATNNRFIDLTKIQLPTHPEQNYVGTLIIAAGGVEGNETEYANSAWGWWWEDLTYCVGITRLVAPENAQMQFSVHNSDEGDKFVWYYFFDQITNRMKPSGLFATMYVIPVTEEEYQKLEQLTK